jgi:TonB-linked SusC/RagA family outer membrane protein
MRKIMLLFAFFGLLGVQVFAQKTITGTVTSADDGSTLPGVSVLVKGTTIATVTDINGKYVLKNVPNDATTLVFSFMGMQTQEVPINGDVVDCAMKPSSVQLNDVVVVAYGTNTKESKTGSVSVIKSNDIKGIPVTSVEKALEGKLAGVQVNNPSGAPGAATTIVIRGIGSINSSSAPLYVIDGIPVVSGNYSYATSNGNVLASLNPDDIASITVLKDAAAASLYGSRAANGVILITTKSGKKGKTVFTFNTEGGFSTPALDNVNFRFMNPEEALTYWRTAAINAGIDPDDPQSGQYYLPKTLLAGPLTNWWQEVYQKGIVQKYEGSLRGGDNKTKFFMSGQYFDQQGIQIGSFMKRYTGRVSIENKISKHFTIGTKLSGAHIKMADNYTSLAYGNPFWAAQSIFPWTPVKNPDGTWNWDIPENNNSNPVALVKLNDRYDLQNKFLGIVYLHVNILKGLTFKTNNSIDYFEAEGRDYRNPQTPEGKDVNGKLYQGINKVYTLTTSNYFNYNLNQGKHSIDAKLGFEAQNFFYKSYSMVGEGMGEDIPYLSNAAKGKDVGYSYSSHSIASFFGAVNYNFDRRYYLSASLRTDGSSRFGVDNRWAVFPAFGVSWDASNEEFLKNVSFINFLKLRASYGTSGNWNIGNYESKGLYSTATYNGVPGLVPSQIENKNLTWEKNTTYDVGLDFTFFKRIDGTVDAYQRNTSAMLLDVPVSYTTGFSTLRKNVGSMTNKGIEASLTVRIIDQKHLGLSLGGNITRNVTNITDLGGDTIVRDGWWRRYRLNKHTLSEYYVYDWAGVNPVDGQGLWYDKNGNITENANAARRVFRGQVQPKFYGGFNLNFHYYGFSVTAGFEYKVGQAFYAMERHYTDADGYSFQLQTVNSLPYWQKPGDVVPNPMPVAGNTSNSNAWGTSRYLQKGSYLSFNNLRVGYTLPKTLLDKTFMTGVTLYASAANVYIWHDVSYWTPKRGYTGGGYALYPTPSTFTFGLNINF